MESERKRRERENKEMEKEEERVGRADSLQEELEARARSGDDAIDKLFARHEHSIGATGDIELREMDESRQFYSRPPPRAVLPGQISAPKTPTTFFVPQKPKKETKAREAAVKIPESSDVTDFAYAKEDPLQPRKD